MAMGGAEGTWHLPTGINIYPRVTDRCETAVSFMDDLRVNPGPTRKRASRRLATLSGPVIPRIVGGARQLLGQCESPIYLWL